MKVLHTSDWHLGASLKTEKRQNEFQKTLSWLLTVIEERKIEALILSGDVFDGYAPSNEACRLYYSFLMDAWKAGLREIVITAGNHDSPTFLEAPKPILEHLSVHVIAHYDHEDLDSMLIPLKESSGEIVAVVCAVPFLRERDIRSFVAGESLEENADRHLAGFRDCYKALCERCGQVYPEIPMIATGHFYATGGQTSGSHVVGSQGNVSMTELPQDVAYYALGHLHLPQIVAGHTNWRYSGSLLPMNFGDGNLAKSVVVLDTADLAREPELVEIPSFQRLATLTGTMESLTQDLEKLKESSESVWVQAENTGSFEPNMLRILEGVCKGSEVRLLVCKNRELNPLVAKRGMFKSEKLTECRPEDVFRKMLAKQEITPERREAMLKIFRDIEDSLNKRGMED